ncbi:carboxylate--amine ligase [Hungatella hathewayi]
MDFKKIRALVTDGGGRQTLTIIRGLKKIGCHVTVLCRDKLDLCYVSRYPDRKLLVKDMASAEGFHKVILREITTGNYDVLIPIAEYSTNLVTLYETEFKKYVCLACAPRDIYIQAYNKQITFEKAMAADIPCPITRYEGEDIDAFLDRTSYPIIIKPRNGVGSIGFHKMDNREQFKSYITEKNINIDEYVVQEFIHFTKRRSAYILMDGKGNAKTAIAAEVKRWFPLDAGTGTCLQTVNDSNLMNNAIKLLQNMNWKGFANVCFMTDDKDGKEKLLEINGRIPASIKICFMCGSNVSQQMMELAFDKEVTGYNVKPEVGLYTRHFQADFIWFLKSPNRFHSTPSWFRWKNTKDIVFYADDPLPFFVYSIEQMMHYKTSMKKRER